MIYFSLFFSFVKIGIFSFGGGYVMIPLIREEIIRNKGWLSSSEFIDIIAIAEMTPGPIAVNSATFVGFNVAGFWGALVSTIGVITPSVVLILASVKFLLKYYQNSRVQSFLAGVRPAIIGLILSAGLIIAHSVISDLRGILIAAVVLGIMVFLKPHPILMIAFSGILGVLLY